MGFEELNDLTRGALLYGHLQQQVVVATNKTKPPLRLDGVSGDEDFHAIVEDRHATLEDPATPLSDKEYYLMQTMV